MHVMLRLVLLPGVLLFGGAPFALAESPLPDPVAPAVIGRPLDQTRTVRPVKKKSAATKVVRPKHAAARPAASPTKVVRQSAPPPQAPRPAQDVAGTPHPPKQALDDRADPRMRLDDVGKGTHFARKPLGAGAYFDDKDRTAVRKYYEAHPASGAAAHWRIGEAVPSGASLGAVPKGLLASLPKLPPGHRYVELGGEVVLIAAGSKMVVDGISRSPR